jgi:hypothetical protein
MASIAKNNKGPETVEPSPGEDKDLANIRYYHGTWDGFFNYWKKRGVTPDPYKGTFFKYPNDSKQRESTLPYQDFGTYKKSAKNKLVESFDDFLKLIGSNII